MCRSNHDSEIVITAESSLEEWYAQTGVRPPGRPEHARLPYAVPGPQPAGDHPIARVQDGTGFGNLWNRPLPELRCVEFMLPKVFLRERYDEANFTKFPCLDWIAE
ncbi:13S globulin seed storage protein 2 [Frankliniella fusca]|uniref:13S globulin seed storage protein 2 n=1 Tax=Frankliniella fusca TaxID=407009 RepID=A0AAE1LUP9_9NEOP|nr:13S globulin seed storage protein 2 [Frankliniella fusca]